jgi:hypothetical protein
MKNLLIAATALATLASAPAFAQTLANPAATAGPAQNGTVTYAGRVNAFCSAVTPTTALIQLGDLSNATGAFVPGAVNGAGGAYGATITCNGANTSLAMTANQITNPLVSLDANALAAGFTNTIDYTATLAKVGSTSYVQNPTAILSDATGGSGASRVVGLVRSNISLTLSGAALASGNTLVAGNYSGTTTFTLTPGV